MLDQTTGTLTAPELLSGVSSVSVFVPQNSDSLVETMIYLIPRDFSASSQTMVMMTIAPQQAVVAMTMVGGYDNMQEFVLAEYSQDTMSYTIHNDQVEAFNAVLANGMDWCYFGNPSEGGIIEDQFATIDLFVTAVVGAPSKAHIYLKKDNWEELYTKDFEKVASDLDKIETIAESKADKVTIAHYNYLRELQPNVYNTYMTNSPSTGSLTITLAAVADTTIYNEYILELKYVYGNGNVTFKNADGTTATIVWANGVAPTFERGTTYLISIANGFGVYSMFSNS